MGNLTRAKEHLTKEQLQEEIKEAKDANYLKRLYIIYSALLHPRKAEEIALDLGVSKSLVQKMISLYNRCGPSVLVIKPSGGRYHEYLSLEEEKVFIDPFVEQAKQGAHVTTKLIHVAYEHRIGRKVYKATVYRLLDRHGWRKVCPRSYHPKADKEAQETFKKISQL